MDESVAALPFGAGWWSTILFLGIHAHLERTQAVA
jgi:hypothetical protein